MPKTNKSSASQKTKVVNDGFTFDELKEVFYFSMLHGATLWQYCLDTNKSLPSTFEKGIAGLLSKVTTPHELQEVLKSRALMVGLFDELVSANASSSNSTALTTGQQAESLDTSL